MPTDPSMVLYHYTTTAGLLGIIEDRCLWASHPRFMNDVNETRRGLELAGARLAEAAKRSYSQYEHAISKWGLWLSEDQNFCTCFSAARDELAMWRGYAPDNGVCIGIVADALLRASTGRLAPVMYNEDEFHARVDTIFSTFEAGDPSLAGEGVCQRLYELAFLLKDAAWREEQEWRLLVPQRRGPTGKMQFRPGSFGLIPYCSVPLDGLSDRPGTIRSITIGPGRFQADYEHSLLWYLEDRRVTASVQKSSVGLRPT